ncbi:MAG: cytidylate kinase-like family protein [Parasporobacterium sp.]|nr:cytidylate kinase-like family protein [Parasporobacterium sp.]
MNQIITIGREFGSGGRELGHKLAQELKIAYYDKQILAEIVEMTEFSKEYVQEVVENRLTYMLPPAFSTGMSLGNEYQIMQMQKIIKAQTEVIKEMAAKSSCVIVGRCADYILRDTEDIDLVRLFVYADMDSRIRRCMERAPQGENYTEKELEKHIRRVDKNRANYYSDFTLQKWGDKSNYDMCINTTNMRIDDIVPHLGKMFF